MKYILHGRPIPLQRPRFYKGHIVDPQRNQKFLDGIQIKRQHGLHPYLPGTLRADIVFFMPICKSVAEKGRDKLRYTWHPYKPDIDNLIKYILDVCNEIVYADDSQISMIHAKKIWYEVGKTEVTFTEINGKEEYE